MGGGELLWYDGDKFVVEQDVVVVLVMYWLGVFGYFQYLGNDVLSLGMVDQVVVLQWIKVNIVVFGGDFDNVMVFG